MLVAPTHLRLGSILVGVTALTVVLAIAAATCSIPISDSNSVCFLAINLIGLFSLSLLLTITFFHPQIGLLACLVWIFLTSFLSEVAALRIILFLKSWL